MSTTGPRRAGAHMAAVAKRQFKSSTRCLGDIEPEALLDKEVTR
ncbi:MAG: hypothetical protein ACYCTE_00765 [Acidimicrobiales bacterium]